MQLKQLRNAIVQVQLECYTYSDLCNCHHEFFENYDQKENLEYDSSAGDDIDDKEGESGGWFFTYSCELCFGGFSLCFLFVYILRCTQNL